MGISGPPRMVGKEAFLIPLAIVGTPVYTWVMVTHKKRTVVYLDLAEREALERLSAKTGAPIAELVRRAVAQYLKKTKKEEA
jgi:hypothetical protein